MTLGDKLRKFGVDRFGSVKLFAEALGMQPPSLQAYLRGTREPGAGILKRLKDLGCSIDWLLSEDDNAEDISPPIDVDKLKAEKDRLEEENRSLRASIGQISVLTQVVENKKKYRRKKV
jgi:transcriptional regulator with XRE-family HTH domain